MDFGCCHCVWRATKQTLQLSVRVVHCHNWQQWTPFICIRGETTYWFRSISSMSELVWSKLSCYAYSGILHWISYEGLCFQTSSSLSCFCCFFLVPWLVIGSYQSLYCWVWCGIRKLRRKPKGGTPRLAFDCLVNEIRHILLQTSRLHCS